MIEFGLLKGLDKTCREIDALGSMGAFDTFTQQAYGILTSGKFAEAMDLSKEDPKIVSRYVPAMKEKRARIFTVKDRRPQRNYSLRVD